MAAAGFAGTADPALGDVGLVETALGAMGAVRCESNWAIKARDGIAFSRSRAVDGLEDLMAEAVGVAILSAVAIEASATVATVVRSIVIVGASIGAQYAMSAMTQKAPKREAMQAVLNQSMAARRRVYGRTLAGGVRAFWEAHDGDLT